MKGLILAGGRGTRLLPATQIVNKHMVPILNRPMIMYPIETLKALGVTDIMIVSGGDHVGGFTEFLGDGYDFGVNLTYRVQTNAGGIAQALSIAEDFAKGESVVVILGDNIFENTFEMKASSMDDGRAHLFVKDLPSEEAKRFGVVMPGDASKGDCIIEKPKEIHTETARVVTGLYVFPPEVFTVTEKQTTSARGEYEITDVNNHFLLNGLCTLHKVKGFWSDAGTRDSLKEVIDWAFKKEI